MSAPAKTQEVREQLEAIFASTQSADELMLSIAKLLRNEMPKYNWVGFYRLEEETANPVLVLGPFEGASTVHTHIRLNQGVCGAAAASGQTIVVDDVNSDPRYLACSLETKSEIVAPIFSRGKLVGELDIDSHFPAAFGVQDRQLVEYCASLVGRCLEKSSSS